MFDYRRNFHGRVFRVEADGDLSSLEVVYDEVVLFALVELGELVIHVNKVFGDWGEKLINEGWVGGLLCEYSHVKSEEEYECDAYGGFH